MSHSKHYKSFHLVAGVWSGIVVNVLGSIYEVNLCWARLVLRWATDRVRVQFPVPDIYFGM